MSLRQLSALYLPAIEDEMRRALGRGGPELDLYYRMLAYHLGWVDADGRPAGEGAAGKRLRPLLSLLACAALGGAWERALPLAAGVELLHNFSLLHDDIQDNSPLRRGRPTAWKLWGAAQAINAGDALFTLAHLALQALPERGVPIGTALPILREFDRTCLALTQGQFLDMQFEARERVTAVEYLTMIEGKTAALIAACAQLGAQVAGAGPERVEHFRRFGRSLGLAFQIQDDLLGIWGDPAVTGKSAASDLEKRKKSLPVVYGLERSEAFARAYAQPHGPSASVEALAAQLEALGAREAAQQMAAANTREAAAHFEAAQPTGPAAEALRELTGQLLSRSA